MPTDIMDAHLNFIGYWHDTKENKTALQYYLEVDSFIWLVSIITKVNVVGELYEYILHTSLLSPSQNKIVFHPMQENSKELDIVGGQYDK